MGEVLSNLLENMIHVLKLPLLLLIEAIELASHPVEILADFVAWPAIFFPNPISRPNAGHPYPYDSQGQHFPETTHSLRQILPVSTRPQKMEDKGSSILRKDILRVLSQHLCSRSARNLEILIPDLQVWGVLLVSFAALQVSDFESGVWFKLVWKSPPTRLLSRCVRIFCITGPQRESAFLEETREECLALQEEI